MPAATTTAPTSTPVAVRPKVAGDDPVVARMRRQIELYKLVQGSCPRMSHQDIQGMALACMGEAPSAPLAGGGLSSSAPTIYMTPVGPAPPPQIPLHSTWRITRKGEKQTSPDRGTRGATTAEVPVTTVTMPRTIVNIIRASEVPGGKALRGAKSWVAYREG